MSVDRKKFFDDARRPFFRGAYDQKQVDGLNALLDAMDAAADLDMRWQSYMLATTYLETAHTMRPIEEYGKGRGHPYGFPAGQWHQIYFGRGYVQLTWESNYIRATKRLRELGLIGADIDLARNPELAMRPDIAAAIMIHGMIEGWFTGKKLADFFNSTLTDWFDARTIINGHDHADLIAGYGKTWFAILTAASAPTTETK